MASAGAGWSPTGSTSPRATGWGAEIALLVNAPVASYGETLLSYFNDYGLALPVGSDSAGCNGNVNWISDLPSKVMVMFTGMKVELRDGSPLWGVGFEPDVPVGPSLTGIRAGRDEVREAALRALAE